MKELLFILAGVLPEEKLVEQLQDSINEWEKDKGSDNFKKLAASCSIIIAKIQVDDNGGSDEGIEKSLKKYEEFENIKKLITPPEN